MGLINQDRGMEWQNTCHGRWTFIYQGFWRLRLMNKVIYRSIPIQTFTLPYIFGRVLTLQTLLEQHWKLCFCYFDIKEDGSQEIGLFFAPRLFCSRQLRHLASRVKCLNGNQKFLRFVKLCSLEDVCQQCQKVLPSSLADIKSCHFRVVI